MGLLPDIASPSTRKKASEWVSAPGDSSSDSEDEAEGKPPMAGSPPGGGPRPEARDVGMISCFAYDNTPTKGMRKNKKYKEVPRSMHQSLADSLLEQSSAGKPGHFYRTKALIGEEAEKSYKEKRIVSTSSVVPHALRESPKRERALHTYSDGTTHVNRQLCLLEPCTLMENAAHMARFFHKCKFGALCSQRRDREHIQLWVHPDPDELETLGMGAWRRENHKSPHCVPTLSVQRYQNHHPAFGYAPRGKFRPLGGQPEPPDGPDEARRKHEIRADTVSIKVEGVDYRWTEEDFYTLIRDSVGNVPIIKSYMTWEGGKLTGEGIIEVGTYADAMKVIQALDGKEPQGRFKNVMRLSYYEGVVDPATDARPSEEGNSGYGLVFKKGPGYIHMVDPGVKRYSRAIRSCGAYYLDAEAVFERMRSEGHVPDQACINHLMRSYAEADPPQSMRAEIKLYALRKEGLPFTVTACNYIVKAWCRAGNMRKAELLVKEMEREKWPLEPGGMWRGEYLPLPNEETYHLLKDAWEQLGVMEDMMERQRGYKFDEDKCTQSVGGVVGSATPANSYVSTWARRRSGYMGLHSGNFVPAVEAGLNLGNVFIPKNHVSRN